MDPKHPCTMEPRGVGSACGTQQISTPARPDSFDYNSPSPVNYVSVTPNPLKPDGYSFEPSPQVPYASAPQTTGYQIALTLHRLWGFTMVS